MGCSLCFPFRCALSGEAGAGCTCQAVGVLRVLYLTPSEAAQAGGAPIVPLTPLRRTLTTRLTFASPHPWRTDMVSKNTLCLWYEGTALDAAKFYAATFPDSAVTAVHQAPSDYPSGKEGDVLTVEFTVMGIPCIGLNGGPIFKHSEAFSFQVATEDQAETDRLWNAIIDNGGAPSACGWCKDKWGLSWQITLVC